MDLESNVRIAVHAGTLRGFGSGIVGRSVLDALRRTPGVGAIMALVPTAWPDDWDSARKGAVPIEVRHLNLGIRSKFLCENITLRRLVKSWNADVLLSLTDTGPIASPVPHVLLVQQAFMAYRREALGFTLPTSMVRRFQVMSAYMRCVLPGVRYVTVQTQHMKAAFCERWGFPPERVAVVPSTVQPAAHQLREAAGPAPGNDRPTAVYLSSPGPHKNHAVLAPMMAALAVDEPEMRCLVTVRPEETPELAEAAARLGVLDRFEFSGDLSGPEAMARLRRATVAVLPSQLESFGIPYHEALALGVPAVAADLPWSREALGDAGLYADPHDGEAWADAVRTALSERETRSLAARARFEDQAWTWGQIAQAYFDLSLEATREPLRGTKMFPTPEPSIQ